MSGLKICIRRTDLDAYKKKPDYLKEKYWAEGSSIKHIRENSSLDIGKRKSKELTGLVQGPMLSIK